MQKELNSDTSNPGSSTGGQEAAILTNYFSDFSPKQIEQFKALDQLYKEWNAKINVLSRKDIEGLYEKHVLHSLAIARWCTRPGIKTCMPLYCRRHGKTMKAFMRVFMLAL